MRNGCRNGRSAAQGCRQLSLSRSPRAPAPQRATAGAEEGGLKSWPGSVSTASCSSRDPLATRTGEAKAANQQSTQDCASARPEGSPAEVNPEELWSLWKQRQSERLGGAGPRALFLDYDGTLREFEARPEQAVPTPEITALLTALNARKDLAPHIVSGRDSGFLESHLGSLDRFTLVAEHGYKLRRPGAGWEHWRAGCGDEEQQRWKAILRPTMLQAAGEVTGSHVEEKASALVWHYREAAAEAGGHGAEALTKRLEQLRAREGLGDVRISCGQKIVEVSYRGVDKGSLVRGLCEEQVRAGCPFEAVLAVGDDKTDEFMFASAPPGSMTIKVGAGDSRAKFRVSSPTELRDFLRCIAAPCDDERAAAGAESGTA
uniref:Trehalose 6-phosphate phosphatase n=1 Tax=Alexandrium catenella TaxID=2925 RepID=A0A7S1WS64_ALECA